MVLGAAADDEEAAPGEAPRGQNRAQASRDETDSAAGRVSELGVERTRALLRRARQRPRAQGFPQAARLALGSSPAKTRQPPRLDMATALVARLPPVAQSAHLSPLAL